MSNVITPEFIISYPQVFEPKPNDNGELFYSCAMVFPAGTDLSALRKAADDAGREKFGAKWDAGVKSGALKLPFRTDTEAKGYPDGATYFSAKTKTKPGIVSRYAGPNGKPQVIDDPNEVYAGARFIASVRFYGYEAKGNKGVGVALNNLQKRGDGERMDGRIKAEDEFAAEEGNALID